MNERTLSPFRPALHLSAGPSRAGRWASRARYATRTATRSRPRRGRSRAAPRPCARSATRRGSRRRRSAPGAARTPPRPSAAPPSETSSLVASAPAVDALALADEAHRRASIDAERLLAALETRWREADAARETLRRECETLRRERDALRAENARLVSTISRGTASPRAFAESTADAGSDRPEPAASRAEPPPPPTCHRSKRRAARREATPPPPLRRSRPLRPPRAHPLVRGRRLARGPRGARWRSARSRSRSRTGPDRRRDRVVGRRGEMRRPPPLDADADATRRADAAAAWRSRCSNGSEQSSNSLVGSSAGTPPGGIYALAFSPSSPTTASGCSRRRGRRDVQTVRLARRRGDGANRGRRGGQRRRVAPVEPLATRRRLRRGRRARVGRRKNNNGATRRVHEPDEPDDEPFLSRGARPYSPGKRPPSFGVFIPRGGPRGRGVLHRRDVARAVPRE